MVSRLHCMCHRGRCFCVQRCQMHQLHVMFWMLPSKVDVLLCGLTLAVEMCCWFANDRRAMRRTQKHPRNNSERLFGEGPLEKNQKNIEKTKKNKKNNIERLFGEGPLEKNQKNIEKTKKRWWNRCAYPWQITEELTQGIKWLDQTRRWSSTRNGKLQCTHGRSNGKQKHAQLQTTANSMATEHAKPSKKTKKQKRKNPEVLE